MSSILPPANHDPATPTPDLLGRLAELLAQWDSQHSGWCCTRDCPEPDGRHPDPTDPVRLVELVGIFGDNPPPLIEHRTIACPRECTCQVGPYIAALRAAVGR